MKFQLSPIAKAISGAVLACALPIPAQATLTTTAQTETFSLSGTQTTGTQTGNSFTSSTQSVSGTTSFNQFNPTLGVLTGANLAITNQLRTQSISANGTNRSSGTGTVTATATGNSGGGLGNYTVGFGGGSVTAASAINNTTASCFTATQGQDCTQTSTPANTTPAGTSVTGATDAMVGTGTINSTQSYGINVRTAKTTTGSASFASTNASYTSTWSGTLSLTYSYKAHASPSLSSNGTLSSQTIDYGTWLRNSGSVSTDSVTIYNNFRPEALTNPDNQVGLNLAHINGNGDTGVLYTDIVTFSGLGAGDAQSPANTYFDTSQNVGSYSATYTLNFADGNPGTLATSSLYGYGHATSPAEYTATVNMTGSIVEHALPTFDNSNIVTEWVIDFGHITTGLATSQSFNIFNSLLDGLLSSERVGLQFLGCSSATGDTADFAVDLCSITPGGVTAAGGSLAGTATFFPFIGARSATYTLLFTDFTDGINGTPYFYELQLTLNAIPEPFSISLMGAGLLAMGYRRRAAGASRGAE